VAFPFYRVLMARIPLLLLPFALAACSTTPPDKSAIEQEFLQDRKNDLLEDQKRREFNAVLLRLEQTLDQYVRALSNQGEYRADQQIEALSKSIYDTVMDVPAVNLKRRSDVVPGETFRRLLARGADGSSPPQQGVALAALGFSGQQEVMPVIVQGTLSADPLVVDRAVLGLAVLRDPATPPGVLAAIVQNGKHPEDGRVQAAWALYRIQTANERAPEIVAIWQKLLTEAPNALPPGVLPSAVRGLGLTRDPAHAELVASFLNHPTPRVRMMAALALGRMNAQGYWSQLLGLLGTQEAVQNVRLHARTALTALAGGVDHEYDVAAWRKAFERGSVQTGATQPGR
jgi:hypothetical protein